MSLKFKEKKKLQHRVLKTEESRQKNKCGQKTTMTNFFLFFEIHLLRVMDASEIGMDTGLAAVVQEKYIYTI